MQTQFSDVQLSDAQTAMSEAVIRTCVHCGFCTATCPTYVLGGNELDSPRGRIYLIKDMLERQRQPSAEVVKHVDRCLSCLACMTTCPSGVHYMHLVDHARAYIEDNYKRPLLDRITRRLLALTLPFPGRLRFALRMANLARPFAPVLAKLRSLKPMAAMLTLAPRRVSRKKDASVEQITRKRGRVAIMRGCVEPVLRPEFQLAAARVLGRAGFEVVEAPGEGCCGALVHHLGRETDALIAARRNVDAWTALVEDGGLEAIIITASGCGTTVKDYGFMLRHDPEYREKSDRIASLAVDISEFLARQEQAPAEHRGIRVAYHSACSLQHGQQIADAPVRLLEAAGYDVETPKESHLCCGSAGTYNILQPDVAAQLGERKARHLSALDADVIATGNIGCATHLAARTTAPVVHTVELLDWAAGGPEPAAMTNG